MPPELFVQTALLIEHGLHGVRLRNATVAELLAVAWVLGLWRSVEEIAQANEEHKRNVLARKVAAGHRSIRSTREHLERPPGPQGKKRRTQRHEVAEGLAAVDHSDSGNDISACKSGSSPGIFVGPTQATDFHPSACMADSVEKNCDATMPSYAVLPVPNSPDTHVACAGVSGTVEKQPAVQTSAAVPANPSSAGTSASGDPCGHLARIGQLVASANPAAPNARAVAAEIVRELLALVEKRLLPDPPAEVLTQLQSAAVRLGVEAKPIHSPQASFTTDSVPRPVADV